jgi:hypothetical protein
VQRLQSRADVEYPTSEATCRASYQPFLAVPDVRMELNPTQKLILRDLDFGPATSRDLVAVTNTCNWTVRRSLRALHDMKLVRICGWETIRGGRIAVWSSKKISDGDVPRPSVMPVKEIWNRANKKRFAVDRQSA